MKTAYNDVSRESPILVDRAASVEPRVIGIFVFDGFSMLPAVEVVDVFDKANQVLAVGHGDAPCYRTVFVSRHGGCVSSSASIDVLTQPAEQLHSARAVFVASGEMAADITRYLKLNVWTQGTTSHPEEVFAIGNGDPSQEITRTSRQTQELTLPTAHGDAWLADGTGDYASDYESRSAVRHALGLIRRDFGVSVLRRVLKQIPDTGLPEFNAIAAQNAKSINEKIRESAKWITRNCHKAITVTVAAQTAGMSDRSYLRHFRAEMGVKPSGYLRRSRVELAATLLESSDLPVDKIARRCGLTSGECLARLFRQVLHISPTEYRNHRRSHSAKICEVI